MGSSGFGKACAFASGAALRHAKARMAMLARRLKRPERDAHDGRDGRGMSISSLQRLGRQAIEAVVDPELDGLFARGLGTRQPDTVLPEDRKSTRLNSSHS